jgi:hypothetical protein
LQPLFFAGGDKSTAPRNQFGGCRNIEDSPGGAGDVRHDLLGRRAVIEIIGNFGGKAAPGPIPATGVAFKAARNEVACLIRPRLAVRLEVVEGEPCAVFYR